MEEPLSWEKEESPLGLVDLEGGGGRVFACSGTTDLFRIGGSDKKIGQDRLRRQGSKKGERYRCLERRKNEKREGEGTNR